MPSPSSAALAGLPMLIVEDDAASSKLLALILTDAGALVQAASSAEEALDVLVAWRPRVILVDLVLPRMGGLLFVETLRKDRSFDDITIVAVTSLNGPNTERTALSAGCDAYLLKPVDTDELIGQIQNCLRG